MSNSSIHSTYRPINLSVKSTTPEVDIEKMFPIFGRQAATSVNAHDIAVGHRWKTFILPLDSKFHEDQYLGLPIEDQESVDCLLNSCDAETILKYGIQYTDYLSELIIFRKLLGSLQFVRNLRDADLVLVPALGVTPIARTCRHRGSCWNDKAQELDIYIKENSDLTKKHLFLATMVSLQCRSFCRFPFVNVSDLTLGS